MEYTSCISIGILAIKGNVLNSIMYWLVFTVAVDKPLQNNSCSISGVLAYSGHSGQKLGFGPFGPEYNLCLSYNFFYFYFYFF